MVGNSYNSKVIVTPVDMSYQASHYYNLQGSHLSNTDDHFSPPILCIELSKIMKDTQ